MKTKFNLILTLLLAFIVQVASAQEKKISGVVSDAIGPMLGVNVMKKGTSEGIDTDMEGAYSLKAKKGDVLVFSFMGYDAVEKIVGASNKINVSLKEASNVLNPVIVVGYGSTTKESFTGTAKVVDAKGMEAKSVSNISQALAGEASGVTVVRSDGRPGADSEVRIRGFGSIGGNSKPLYVVDGVPFLGEQNSINPSDVESTVILKDAAATAIYGSRGANGVIVITTRKGKAGKTVFSLDMKTTVNSMSLPRYELINNEEEYIGMSYRALKNAAEFNGDATPEATALANLFDGGSKGVGGSMYNLWDVASTADLIDTATGKVKKGVKRRYTPEDWADYGFQTSIRKELNFKMSGGTAKAKHYLSLGYLDDVGYIKNSDYKRYSARINLNTKPLKWLKTNTGLSYTNGVTNDATGKSSGGQTNYMLNYMPTIYPVFERDADGKLVEDPISKGKVYDFGLNGRGFGIAYNAIGASLSNLKRDTRHSVNGNIGVIATLFKGLTFESAFSSNIYSNTRDDVRGSLLAGSAGADKGGQVFKTQELFIANNFNQMLRYRTKFNNVHGLSFLIAHESNEETYEMFDLAKDKVVNLNPNAGHLPSNYLAQGTPSKGYIEDAATESYFGQLNYDYADKYFVQGTVRRDGSSRFNKNKWGNFGSLGLGYVISKEDFMKSASFISYMKLKASYGVLGDQGKKENYYNGQAGFDIATLQGQPSLVPLGVVDPDITWESSNQFQTGVEFSLFKDRIDVALDYYTKKTSNLFVEKKLAASTGDTEIRTNDGELMNKGFEFDITGHIIKKKDVKLSLTVNGEMFKNEITKMPIENATGKPKVINVYVNKYGRALGRGIYDFYMRDWQGVDKTNGNAQWTQYWVDADSNDKYDAGEEVVDLATYKAANPNAKLRKGVTSEYAAATAMFIDKSVVPKVRGAFRLNAFYKGFSFSTQFGYSIGGYGYDQEYATLMSNDQVGKTSYHIDKRNSWKKVGDITNTPRIYSNENNDVSSRSSRFIISTDYLALNNFSVGYSLSQKYLGNSGIKGLRMSVTGDNLFIMTKRLGYNPTTSLTGATDREGYSPVSSYTLGVNIKL